MCKRVIWRPFKLTHVLIFTFESLKHQAPSLDFHQCFRTKQWKAVVTSKSKQRKEPDASITLLRFFIYLFIYFILFYFFISLYLLYVSAVIADRAFLYMVRDCHNFSGIILDRLRCFWYIIAISFGTPSYSLHADKTSHLFRSSQFLA